VGGDWQHCAAGAFAEGPPSAAAWQAFERHLGEALSDLSEDEHLVIIQKGTARYVQFVAQGRHGMRAEAVANAFLPPKAQLAPEATAALTSIGWRAPTYVLAKRLKEPADGSCNFYLDAAAPVPFNRLSALGVRTLREAYGVRHPGELEYSATSTLDDTLDIRFPSLRLKRAAGR
jgi:hypothetical protein